MIVHFENQKCRQKDYGLEIPLLSSRPNQILGEIRNHEEYRVNWEEKIVKIEPLLIDKKLLLRVHDSGYVEKLLSEANAENEVIKAYELRDGNGHWYRYHPENATSPLSDLVRLQFREAQATMEAGKIALETGFSYLLGGGMHHAMSDLGRGFCLVNDIVILAKDLLQNGTCKNVWVVDVDAHKGDGTASLTANDQNIVTLSIHMAKGWPLDGSPPDDPRVMISSNIDIAVNKGEESSYIDRLRNGMEILKSKYPRPDFAIIVNGSDPYKEDALPSTDLLNLTLPQLLLRDTLIFDEFRSLDIPQVWLMAGGYGDLVYKVHAQFLIELLRSGKI